MLLNICTAIDIIMSDFPYIHATPTGRKISIFEVMKEVEANAVHLDKQVFNNLTLERLDRGIWVENIETCIGIM